MSNLGPFVLVHDRARALAELAVRSAAHGMVVTIRPPTRTHEQNAMLHAALTDIAEQFPWHGQKLSVDVWKRLCTASWLREIGESPEMIPALDGKGFDVIFERTSQLTVAQMTSLIEWTMAFAVQHGVTLHDAKGPTGTIDQADKPPNPPSYCR